MPTYEYKCVNGHTFSRVQSIHDSALSKCSSCGDECRRQIFPVGFQLKGTGWAKDGYGLSKGKPSKDQ